LSNDNRWYKITSIETGDYIDVYDLIDVETEHSFFANDILVHNCLYLDEFAFVPNNIAHDFLTSVYPTISSGKTSKIIVSSTPRGLNHFYKMVTDARNKISNFIVLEYDWTAVPHRDQKWANDQKQTLGDKFAQEHEIEFIGSAGTLISATALKNLAFVDPIKDLMEYKFKVYEDPQPGTPYVLVADSSHGKELDYSAFIVFDISKAPYKMVARYKHNNVSAWDYPGIIKTVAMHYNRAFVLAENNDIGAMVLKILMDDLEYEHLFYTQNENTDQGLTFMGGATVGIRTTKKTKRQGCASLKTMLESNQIIVQDFETISELTTYVIQKNQTYAADAGCNDDLVMCLVLFSWLCNQPIFKDLNDSDMRKKLFEQHEKDMEQDMPPPIVQMVADPDDRLNNTTVIDGCVWEIVKRDEDMVDDRYSGYPDPRTGFWIP
jgi:hypothetical protein